MSKLWNRVTYTYNMTTTIYLAVTNYGYMTMDIDTGKQTLWPGDCYMHHNQKLEIYT